LRARITKERLGGSLNPNSDEEVVSQAILQSDTITHQRKLHFALELSKKRWVVAFADGSAAKPKIHEIQAGDLVALEGAIASAKRRFKLGDNTPMASCYEAGRDGFWIHRMLVARGVHNTVVEPGYLADSRRGRSPKTDRLDAKALVEMLVRAERGDRMCRVVRVPTEKQENERRLHRRREALVKERTQHTNRIGSLLLLEGIRVDKVLRMTVAHLDGLRRWDGTPLPSALLEQIKGELRRLAVVREELHELEAQLKIATKADPLSCMLMKLQGVGERSARVLSTEFFGWREFRNQRQVGALAGLVGTPFASGSMAREQGISKAGNRRVRGVMIELAWMWLRHQPGSALAEWFRRRVGEKPTSRQKRVAVVALARKLLVALWRYCKDGTLPKDATLKKERQKKTAA
jgi:transposase